MSGRFAKHRMLPGSLFVLICMLVSLGTTGQPLLGAKVARAANVNLSCTGTRFFASAGVGKIFHQGDTHLGGTFTYIENDNYMEVRQFATGEVVGTFHQPRRLGDVATIDFAFNRMIRIVGILWYDNDPKTAAETGDPVDEAGWSFNGIPGPLTGDFGSAVTTVNIVTDKVTIDAGQDSGGLDFCYQEIPQGCTPGYWKVAQHLDSWALTNYTPSQTLESVFDVPNALGYDNVKLLQALSFDGGSDIKGAARILFRAAVPALLNATHDTIVTYPYSEAQIIADVNAALATTNRATMLALATKLDRANNSGCPLN